MESIAMYILFHILYILYVYFGIFNYGNRQIAYVRDDRKKLSKVFWQIIALRILLTIFTVLIYFLVVLLMKKYVDIFFIYFIYIISFCIDCTWLYVGVEDMKWAVIKNTITKVITVIGIFVFVKSPQDLWKYVLIQGISLFFSNFLAYTQLRLYVKKGLPDFSNLKKDLIGSIKLFLPSLAATIYLQCDKIMIELMKGKTDQLSFYDYSEKIVTIPLTFITVLNTVMMPRIANEFKKNNKDKIADLINKATTFSLFLAFPIAFGLIATAKKLIPWYLGSEFLETANAIIIISPIIIANAITGISGSQYFTATNQIHILLKAQIYSLICNVLINAMLIPSFGFYGAAIATVFTSFLNAIIQLKYLLKQIKLDNLFKNIMKYLLSSIFMFLIIYLFTRNMNSNYITSIIQVFIGAIVYLIINLLTKDENLYLIINIIIKKLKNKVKQGVFNE